MKNNNKTSLIFISSLVIIGGSIGFWLWRKAKKKKELEAIKSQYSLNENLAGVKQQFGEMAIIGTNPNDKKPNDIIVVFFNDKKHKAQFYGAGTLFIFDTTVNPPKQLINGTYSNGGTNIKLSNGKEINKPSNPLSALQETIK